MAATAEKNPVRTTGGASAIASIQTASIQPGPTARNATAHRPYPEAAGLVMLALALLFNALLLAPEARIERVPVNDLPFQIEASQRLGESIAHGEPFLDPWVSQWSLGFPLWRIYQPLAHLAAAAVIALCRPFAAPAASFAAFYYLLLVLVPASTYLGARLMGLNPLAAGLASILILAPNEGGDFGRYGLSYGAYVWRGSGLFTELFAFDLMLPALGLVARAIDSGRRQTGAALGLALTTLSHIFFGYIAFVSTAIWALITPSDSRSQRVARAVSIAARAMLLLAWFVVPMMLAGGEVNRSRWDPAYKFDSYGAPVILRELFSGGLFDFGRAPVLSLMVALGVLTAAFNLRDVLARRLLVLTTIWLGLFFGRETWGHLLGLAGIPSQFHLHRLEAAFELFAILLAAWGLERAIAASMRAPAFVTIVAGVVLGAAILLLAMDRAQFLRVNAMWGEANLTAYQSERVDLEAALNDVRAILTKRPGRVSTGSAADWGASFKIGFANVYSFVTRAGFDEATQLYHTISLTSDYMVLHDENQAAQEDFLGIRAVVAPVTTKVPSYFRRRSVHGRIAVYETSIEGYFGLVDIGASYDGPPATWFDPISRWLPSWMLRAGEVVAVNSGIFPGVPVIGRWQGLPAPSIQYITPRGHILLESKAGETYRATIDVLRPCYGFIKITYFPGLVARIDGKRERLIRVFPDFGAFALTPGRHEVEVRYEPGPLKPLLFLAGIGLFVLTARPSRGAYWERGEQWLQERLERCGEWLATDRVKIVLALAFLALIFTRGLFRGVLVDGHDSLTYPPRLTEFARVIGDHQFPPLWAPDLGSGHGQPLFEFAPPLIYAVALPFFECGMRLADSLQFGLVILFAIGAIAVYLLGRKLSFTPISSIGAAAAWLFAPYQALDVYVSVRMAEASALAVAPLALLGLMRALERPSLPSIALAAAALALVPLAHNAIALLLFPVFAAIVVVRSAISDRPLRTGAAGAAALAGGVGLSAFFWLPALLEKQFVKIELLLTDFLNWRVHIISPWQLLWGHWGFGYSMAGPNDGISFSLGLVHIALAIAGVAIGVRALNRTRRCDAMVFAGAALAGALLATDWSSPIWARVATLQYLQFPWRTLFLPALFMPLLTLFVFERVGPKASIALIALIAVVNLSHTQPKGYQTFDEEYFYPASIAKTGYETTTRGEYVPRWVKVPLQYTGVGLISPDSRLSVRTLSSASTRHVYAVTAPAAVTVMDSTLYYPGWTVLIDGRETAVTPAPAFGTISFLIPPGQHVIAVELLPTPVRRFALMVSMLTFALLLLAAVISWVWRRDGAGPRFDLRGSTCAVRPDGRKRTASAKADPL
ncbi:MAG: hypothetical protein WBE69_17035 [Candidatus Binataceae bacterium]